MKFKIPVPAAMIGMLAGIALFAVTLVLDTSIPGAASGLICGGGGVLVGLCGTALGLAWADRRLTPEERQEIARGERDERNMAIREKAAYTSWFWSLYLLWALWAFTLVAQGGMYVGVLAVAIVLHCVFYLVNMKRWGRKL